VGGGSYFDYGGRWKWVSWRGSGGVSDARRIPSQVSSCGTTVAGTKASSGATSNGFLAHQQVAVVDSLEVRILN
jgi:hypothetical protein